MTADAGTDGIQREVSDDLEQVIVGFDQPRVKSRAE